MSGFLPTPTGRLRAQIRRRTTGLAVVVLLGMSLGLLALATRPARADYQGPDENASQAYGPLQGAHTYSAMLNNSGSNPGDQDWYYFYVPAAGDHLQFTISNTSS